MLFKGGGVSAVSSWILSIAGVVCLSVLIELVLPDGQMNRYIKGTFSFVIVLVIISPIPKLLNSNYDVSKLFNYDETYMLDENYLYQLNLNKLNKLQEDVTAEAYSNGYKNVKVYIDADIFDSHLNISSVYVDLSELVISQNAEHRDITKIKQHITNLVQQFIEIDEEKISYGN
ncbi:MAG: stage III sporulation protein AF [Clostridia bacterium]|nr:stage III sporulation protein AF [Clostridia bacterium]